LLEEFLDELAVAILPIAQLHEFNPHLDVQLNVKCTSVLKLDVDFMSIRVIGQNNALYYFASDVFDKGVGHFPSCLGWGIENCDENGAGKTTDALQPSCVKDRLVSKSASQKQKREMWTLQP
jgi:hypothetical protein